MKTTLLSVGFGIFCLVALAPGAQAYSCRTQAKVEGTLCSLAGTPSTRLVIGESVEGGLLSERHHPYSLIIGNQKVDQGVCKGTLATASMLLGPAECSSRFARVSITGDLEAAAQSATVRTARGQLLLSCVNTCVDPRDL